MIAWLALFITLSLSQTAVPSVEETDRIEVVVPVEFEHLLHPGSTSGRLKLFFNKAGSKNHGEPADGPFFEDPQPIYSVSVQSLHAGQGVVIDSKAIGWPPDCLGINHNALTSVK